MKKYKHFIYGLIAFVIFVGAIVPFGAQFWLPFFKEEAFTQGAEVWNQYVSIVLGIIATILSIVSLKMCFDSEESAKKSEIRTAITWQKIEGKLETLSEKQDYIYHTVSQSQPNTQTNTVNSSNTKWEQLDKNKRTNMIIDEEV